MKGLWIKLKLWTSVVAKSGVTTLVNLDNVVSIRRPVKHEENIWYIAIELTSHRMVYVVEENECLAMMEFDKIEKRIIYRGEEEY